MKLRTNPPEIPVWRLALILALALPCIGYLLGPRNSPVWWERYQQRRQIAAVVEPAGGWEAVRRECAAWVAQNDSHDLSPHFLGRDVPAFSKPLAALKPREFWYYPPEICATPKNSQPGYGVVKLKIFGQRHSERSLYVAVAVGPKASQFAPETNSFIVDRFMPQRSRPLAPGIVEFW